MSGLSRRAFVTASTAAVTIPALHPRTARAAVLRRIDGGLPGGFPSQDPDAVREVVGKSHGNFDGVRELVVSRPQLAKSAWDWGFGDWESALGAASHVGHRGIAELLMEHGARPDLFTFAMLGQVDVVRAVCEANPGIQRNPGPHGITLLQHARHGREGAASVVEYLEELGDADIKTANLPIDEAGAAAFMGAFRPEGVPGVVFHVKFHERYKGLTFQRDDRTSRFLNRAKTHEFTPAGANAVRIAFEMKGDRAEGLVIHDGDLTVKATRTAVASAP